MALKLKDQLNQAELRLKRLERSVKLITLLSTVVTILSVLASGLLTYRQYRESTEKARVSFTYRLTPILLPQSDRFYVRLKLKNLATRELTILGVSVRVWTGNNWTDASSVGSQPNDLIIADNLVRDCPERLCTKEMKNGALRMRDLSDITLEPTEGESELTLGPYPITAVQLSKGLWLTGKAYTAETDAGKCAIHTTEIPPLGAFPYLCEENANGKESCFTDARCSNAESPATFYEFRSTDKSLQAR
jgi:hypothetical protein